MQGNPQVIADLQRAASMETAIQLQYHMDYPFLRQMELHGWQEHADKFGESSECITKKICRLLLGTFGSDPAYSASSPTPSHDPQALLNNWLAMESACHDAYRGFWSDAIEAADVDTSHAFKDFSEVHRKRLAWIQRKLDQIDNYGAQQYLLQVTL